MRDDVTAAVRSRPGAVALHPVVLVALALLVVNDHVLKDAVGNAVTGKLSDVAGLVVAPAVLVAAVELAHGRTASRRTVWLCAAVVGSGFAALQLVPAADAAWETVGGWTWWLLGGLDAGGPVAVRNIADPSDLVALPAGFVLPVLTRSRNSLRRAPSGRHRSAVVGILALSAVACLASSDAAPQVSGGLREVVELAGEDEVVVSFEVRRPRRSSPEVLVDPNGRVAVRAVSLADGQVVELAADAPEALRFSCDERCTATRSVDARPAAGFAPPVVAIVWVSAGLEEDGFDWEEDMITVSTEPRWTTWLAVDLSSCDTCGAVVVEHGADEPAVVMADDVDGLVLDINGTSVELAPGEARVLEACDDQPCTATL